MPKAQVLLTVTAEALIDLPDGVDEVEAYCRDRVTLGWGDLRVEQVLRSTETSVHHVMLPEPEPEPVVEAMEPVVVAPVVLPVEPSLDDTLPLPVLSAGAAVSSGVLDLLDDPAYRRLITAAVRGKAERLLEEIVEQVVAELEPLLERHYARHLHGAQ